MLADRMRVFLTIGLASALGVSLLVARAESNVVEAPTLTLPAESEAINVSISQRRHTGIVVDPVLQARLERFGARPRTRVAPTHEELVCRLPARHAVDPGAEIDVELDVENARMRRLQEDLDAR